MVKVARDLQSLFSATPLLKAGSALAGCSGPHPGFAHLQERRLHSLPGQLVQVKKKFSHLNGIPFYSNVLASAKHKEQ